MKLSVIIVSYNVRYFLEPCLCSVRKACKHMDAEIIVVDNASSDGSRDFFEGRFSQVRFIWNDSNAGFSKACNMGLSEAKGEHVLFLNPDTIVPEDCFEKCLAYFATHADCCALGVHMIDGTGHFLRESKRSFPSPLTSFFKMSGLCSLFPHSRLFAKYYAGHIDEKQTASVEVLSGAFMMVSRKILNRVNGFDEDYFMYGEDIDLSYRMKKTGFKNIYFADTTIIHFKGESTTKNQPEYLDRFYGAMKIFVDKCYREQKLTRHIMRFAISCSKFMAGIKNRATGFFSSLHDKQNNTSLLIVADQERFNEMIQLLKYAPTPLVICGRVRNSNNDPAPASGQLEEAAMLLSREKANAMLFCENDMSFATIISQIEMLKGKAHFLIHSKNCEAIVGSNNKDTSGTVIVKESSAG